MADDKIFHMLNSGTKTLWCGTRIDISSYVQRWGTCTCPKCHAEREKGWYNCFSKHKTVRERTEPDMKKLRAYWEGK